MTRQEIIDELRQIAGYSRSKAAVCREAADLLERDLEADALLLYNAIGGYDACSYNGNSEWLPLVCDDWEDCGKSSEGDPLFCWKQFIKHYGERRCRK